MKKTTSIVLEEEIWDKFRFMVQEKYGTIQGTLGAEVRKALELRMFFNMEDIRYNSRGNIESPIKKNNEKKVNPNKILRNNEKLFDIFKENCKLKERINKKQLVNIISLVFKTPSTIDDKIVLLENSRYIEGDGIGVWKNLQYDAKIAELIRRDDERKREEVERKREETINNLEE